jgi:hypothetical protein
LWRFYESAVIFLAGHLKNFILKFLYKKVFVVGPDHRSTELVNFVPNGSSSLLFKASEHGQREVVRYLIGKNLFGWYEKSTSA